MNYMSHDLVQSKLDDYRREADRMGRVAEARRASKRAWARSAQQSSWAVVRRAPAFVMTALSGFGA